MAGYRRRHTQKKKCYQRSGGQVIDCDVDLSVEVGRLSGGLFFDQDPAPDCDSALLRGLTTRLLAQLDGIPATGFVTEGRICNDLRVTLLPELLNAWLDAGHDLGNHTFSHHAFQNAGREAFEIDVLRGEATASYLLEARGKALTYFRYPFLHAPAVAAEKEAFETFLTRQGYTVAPVTLDNDEWIYAWAYSKALDRSDTTLAQRIGNDYVRYMEEEFAFNEAFSRELLGREIPQILRWVATPDTVLRRVRLEGIDEDRGEVRHRFQFQDDPGHRPLLLSYWHRPDSANRARLVSGTIYIQHFALDGESSGRFEGSLYFPTLGLRVGTAFWAYASRENVTPTHASR